MNEKSINLCKKIIMLIRKPCVNGKKLKELRKHFGLNQHELGNHLDIKNRH